MTCGHPWLLLDFRMQIVLQGLHEAAPSPYQRWIQDIRVGEFFDLACKVIPWQHGRRSTAASSKQSLHEPEGAAGSGGVLARSAVVPES